MSFDPIAGPGVQDRVEIRLLDLDPLIDAGEGYLGVRIGKRAAGGVDLRPQAEGTAAVEPGAVGVGTADAQLVAAVRRKVRVAVAFPESGQSWLECSMILRGSTELCR